jgi:hypothetical protein
VICSNKSFVIEVRAYDKLSNIIVESTLSVGVPLLDFYREGSTSGVSILSRFNSAISTYATQVISSWATMLYTTYVDVVSSILCKHQDVRDTSTSYFTGNNILARIYISPDRYYSVSDTTIIGVKPFQLHYEFPVPKEIKWEPTEFLPSCNIRLQDDKGNLLYFLPTASTVPGLVGSTLVCGNTAFVQMSMLISEATY